MACNVGTTITVCMSSYNHEPYIRRAIEGVLIQNTSFDVRVVIHDDASTDASGDIIMEYARSYPDKVIALIEPTNCYLNGRPPSLRFADYVIGGYVAFCECDDYWTDPNKLQMQAGFMDAHPQVSATYHNCELLFEGEVSEEDRLGKMSLYGQRPEGEYTLDDLAHGRGLPGQTASLMLRRDVFDEYQSPESPLQDVPMNGDMKMLATALVMGKVYTLTPSMSVHRVVTSHGDSWSARSKHMNLAGKNLLGQVGLKQFVEKTTGLHYDNDRSIFGGCLRLVAKGLLKPREKGNRQVFLDTVDQLGGGRPSWPWLSQVASGMRPIPSVMEL